MTALAEHLAVVVALARNEGTVDEALARLETDPAADRDELECARAELAQAHAATERARERVLAVVGEVRS